MKWYQMSCVSCEKEIDGTMMYGTIQEPLCLDCHLDCRKWCKWCNAYTAHTQNTIDPLSGYCAVCQGDWREGDNEIMIDIQAVESDLNYQYMQAKLIEFSEVKL